MKLKNALFTSCIIVLLNACASISNPLISSVSLPDGSHGYVLDCTGYGMASCFKAAGETCRSGYLIHERTQPKDVSSKIPVSELPSKKLIIGRVGNQYERADIYMIISCK